MIEFGTEDVIDSRVGVHDINQFEVKLDYVIDPSRRRNRYRVDAFLFVPYSLGVGPQTYSRDQFYSDMQAYIRFKTPTIALNRLIDPASDLSPFVRVERLATELKVRPDDPALHAKLEHELLLLGCLVRGNLRDRAKAIRGDQTTTGTPSARSGASASGEGQPPSAALLAPRCETLVDEIDQVIARLRALRGRAHADKWPPSLLEVVDLADEYISVVAEIQLTRLVALLDAEAPGHPACGAARQAMTGRILAERQHRRDNGYLAVMQDEGDNEHFVYRRAFLKKVVMSVLFLKIRRASEGKKASDLAGAAAAALAMLVATVAAIVAQTHYGVNTGPFVLALVAAYVVKDRIKEWLRQYLAAKMAPWIADYAVDIRDPDTAMAIGRCRETFTWLSPDRVPPEVWDCRHEGAGGGLEVRTKAELIMHYRKEIALRSDLIEQHHSRLHDINDILRFAVTPFLSRADDRLKTIARYLPEEDRVVDLQLPKVYHLNTVLVLTALDRERAPEIQRVRVVFDKAGIKRVEAPDL